MTSLSFFFFYTCCSSPCKKRLRTKQFNHCCKTCHMIVTQLQPTKNLHLIVYHFKPPVYQVRQGIFIQTGVSSALCPSVWLHTLVALRLSLFSEALPPKQPIIDAAAAPQHCGGWRSLISVAWSKSHSDAKCETDVRNPNKSIDTWVKTSWMSQCAVRIPVAWGNKAAGGKLAYTHAILSKSH